MNTIRGTAFNKPYGLGTLLLIERMPVELGPDPPIMVVNLIGLRLVLELPQ